MTMTLAKDGDLRAALEATRPNVCAPSLEKGKPISICSGEADGLDYFVYVPKNARVDSPVVAAVHGLRRSAAQQIFQLKAEAERCGMILFAPLFAREQFRHFQTLTPNETGVFPETAFEAALEDCLARLELTDPQLFLFGFSGGAQFAHRYALTARRRLDKLVLMAPGWFTMPDPNLPFPYGIGASEELGKRQLDLKRALKCPTLLLVGERDTKRTSSLNQDPLIDAHQGRTRLERCESWIAAMQAQPDGDAIEELMLVKGGGHSLERMVHRRGAGARIFDWLAR